MAGDKAAAAATLVDSAPTIYHASPRPTPSTPSEERADPWEELSAATAQSGDFSVLKGYERVPLYERRDQWLADQQLRREQVLQRWLGGDPKGFDPNRHLPFPITAQFLQHYGGGGGGGGVGGAKKTVRWKREDLARGSGGSERTVVRVRDNHSNFAASAASSPVAGSPVSERSEPEAVAVAVEEGRPPALSRNTSGIPSYDSLFETKWDFEEPLKTPASAGSRRQSFAFPSIPSGLFFGHKSYLERRYSEFKEKLASHVQSALRHQLGGFPLGLFTIIGFLGLTVLHVSRIPPSSITLSNPLFSAAGIYSHHTCNDTLPPANIAPGDFPALVSIEASLEEALKAIIARSPASAQLLKQGELAISDLGTVVRHSDLRCKQTLSGLLEDLATSSGEVGMSLQGFESRVLGFLDQVDTANRGVLRDLSALRRQTRYTSLPFTGSGSLTRFQTRQLSSSFHALGSLVDSTLSALISETDGLLASLSDLARRHGPIYALIVQEFTAIERRQRTLWTRAPAQSYRESKDLLALVGGSEEKTRGYAERIGMELGRLRMEMEEMKGRRVGVGRREDSAAAADAAGLGGQIEAVWEMVERRAGKRKKPGSGCLSGRGGGGGWGRSGTNGSTRSGYRQVFKPTRTRPV